MTAGGAIFLSDEPMSLGGLGEGASPYDLLVAALGACTGMTIRLYAARKELPLDDVRITLRHARIHAEDCTDCETRVGKLDEIQMSIEMIGDLTAEQRARLLEIAQMCPVHRTLTSEIKIRTALAS
ncbi:MAG: OsmC family protein [Caulobacteraceae bacterium]